MLSVAYYCSSQCNLELQRTSRAGRCAVSVTLLLHLRLNILWTNLRDLKQNGDRVPERTEPGVRTDLRTDLRLRDRLRDVSPAQVSVTAAGGLFDVRRDTLQPGGVISQRVSLSCVAEGIKHCSGPCRLSLLNFWFGFSCRSSSVCLRLSVSSC